MRLLDEEIILEKNKKHNIDVIVDRIVKKEGYRSRLADSLEIALKLTDGEAIVENLDAKTETLFSQHLACPHCGFSVPKLEPRLFSFNNPLGSVINEAYHSFDHLELVSSYRRAISVLIPSIYLVVLFTFPTFSLSSLWI